MYHIRANHRQAALLVLAIASTCVAVAMRWRTFDEVFGSMDPDSAMRLVQVRDLLGGQGWFDLTQHRLGFGTGVEMHWSRLIDGAMAAIILGARLILDDRTAEWFLLIIWPTALLAVTFWACLSLSHRIGGVFAAFAAFVTAICTLPAILAFGVGSLDHHNVQLMLLMLALWGFVSRHDNSGASLLAGWAVSASLVIGVELLPVMIAYCCVFAGTWIVRGTHEQKTALGFSIALTVGLLGQFLLMAPGSAYVGGYCDALSADLLLPIVGVALVLGAGVAWLSSAPFRTRACFLAIMGSLMLVAALAAFPSCLSNPYERLDPVLVRHWFDYIAEAQGLQEVLGNDRGLNAVLFLLGAAGAPISLYLMRTGKTKAEFCMFALVTLVTAGFAIHQIRYLTFLITISIPVWGWLAAFLKQRSSKGGSVWASLGAVFVLAISVPQAWALAINVAWPEERTVQSASRSTEEALEDYSLYECFTESDFDRIATLQPGLVASTSNLGSYILMRSDHKVLSAPYHRNQAGMLAQLEIALADTPQLAEERLRKIGVDYIVLCTRDPELYGVDDAEDEKEPFLVQLFRGELSLDGYPLLMQEGDIYVFGSSSAITNEAASF